MLEYKRAPSSWGQTGNGVIDDGHHALIVNVCVGVQYASDAADKTEMEGLGRDPVLFEAWSNHTRLR